MEIKKLTNQIVHLLLSINKQTSEDRETERTKIYKVLLQKIKPLFEEEIKILQESPDALHFLRDFKHVLQDELKEDEELQEELNSLIAPLLRAKIPETHVIENSDKVISGSTITVHGDMHIGDIINTHLKRKSSEEIISYTKEEVEKIKRLISKGCIEEAIDLLLYYSKKINQDLFNETIGIARQWEAFQRESRMGILSRNEKFKWANTITLNLLDSTDALLKKAHNLFNKKTDTMM